MTVRDCYEACLIELNKVQAPSLLLSDFIYLLNKNIQEYFNKKYTSFEKIQQNTDDLRQLINWVTINETNGLTDVRTSSTKFGVSYECELPKDYVHILGCRAVFRSPAKRCSSCKNRIVGLNKLDTNQAPQIDSNWYMRPSPTRPYYQIINIEQGDGKIVPDPTQPGTTPNSDKQVGKRYGNATQPIMQILCGEDLRQDDLISVEVQYLQAPRYISIEQFDLDSVEDTSAVLEFSDYVCNEIIKQLVTQIMENNKEERTQSFVPVNTSIPPQN